MTRGAWRREFPLENLQAYAEGRWGRRPTSEEIATAVGISLRTIARIREKGMLTRREADHFAVGLFGEHPSRIWPTLWWIREERDR